MAWLKGTFCSSIATMMLVGVTGLGLLGFLIAHLASSMLIYTESAGALNPSEGALHAVSGFSIVELGLALFFLLHLITTLQLSRAQGLAQGPSDADERTPRLRGLVAQYANKTMMATALIALGFLALNLVDLRFQPGAVDGSVALWLLEHLSRPLPAALYAVVSFLVSWQLSHVLQRVFSSLGFNRADGTPILEKMGSSLALLLGIGFASVPVWIAFLN